MKMPRGKKKKDDDLDKGSPAWMTTYGDMMTLLLVFFVLLYSFSVMDLDKFKGFISALQSKLGVLDGGMTVSEESALSRGSTGEKFNPANYSKVMGEMQQYIETNKLQESISMELSKRGLVIRFTGQILFDIGEALIKPRGREILNDISDILKNVPNDIVVEGHTDNWPINNENFPSNWELSTARATNVIKYFIENGAISPAKLSAAGYSKYHPLFPNDTSEHRANNRRIEVVLLNSVSKTANISKNEVDRGDQDG